MRNPRLVRLAVSESLFQETGASGRGVKWSSTLTRVDLVLRLRSATDDFHQLQVLHSDTTATLCMPGYPPRHVCAAEWRFLLTYLLHAYRYRPRAAARESPHGRAPNFSAPDHLAPLMFTQLILCYPLETQNVSSRCRPSLACIQCCTSAAVRISNKPRGARSNEIPSLGASR